MSAASVSYDDLLEKMDRQYLQKTPRSKPSRDREAPSQDISQSASDTTPRPASGPVRFRPTDRSNVQSQRNPHLSRRTTARPPRKHTPIEEKPRRIPPPIFKPTPGLVTEPRRPTDPTTRSVGSPSEAPDPPQDSQSELLTEQPAVEQSSDPTATFTLSYEALKRKSSGKAAFRSLPRHVDSIPKVQAQTESSAETTDETTGLKTPSNPLEAVTITKSRYDKVGKVFDNIFLRDSCACAKCVDTSTRQKRFDSADIPTNIRIRSLQYEGDSVVITWKHDVSGYGPDHQTRLSRNAITRSPHGPLTTMYTSGKSSWHRQSFEARAEDFDYNEYMSDEKVVSDLLRQLHTHGLVFIKNVPEAESSVIETANRIGPLKNTFYGDTWDVRSVSNAKNVAYTDVHLGFHMDLLYMQQPPRLQLLHCLRASTEGGVSLFSDSYRAMDQLHKMNYDGFRTLVETPVNFHYDNDSHHYFRQRRTFQLQDGTPLPHKDMQRVWNLFEAVNWAPPFQAPFCHKTDGDVHFAESIRAWHQAAQLFRDLTEMEANVYRRQMAPGECVIFDNRRVLHARTAFAGGERWLRGAYLDDDPYLSKMRVLERTHGGSSRKPRARAAPGA
ncbi:Clavaminate synthase-like protein [Aureobasidium subglaciale]|nr:Clavaminate synthase-like protein [Aureobasidium subglaciale]KAI5231821.1 Clavaminate synthase-like protein [Aureobasidium subglaciale]KAI5234276.1 Clavaminate synthase-like protein [Aureobasidium subglaciale]KAI5267917.1 Clavaminate synthase-like protein [Aureobasidium subglaciale]